MCIYKNVRVFFGMYIVWASGASLKYMCIIAQTDFKWDGGKQNCKNRIKIQTWKALTEAGTLNATASVNTLTEMVGLEPLLLLLW